MNACYHSLPFWSTFMIKMIYQFKKMITLKVCKSYKIFSFPSTFSVAHLYRLFNMKFQICLDMTQCWLLNSYTPSGGVCCLYFWGLSQAHSTYGSLDNMLPTTHCYVACWYSCNENMILNPFPGKDEIEHNRNVENVWAVYLWWHTLLTLFAQSAKNSGTVA
jgi:hypothetical protein